MPEMMAKPETGFDAMDPANVSPFVVWLGSGDCDVTGRVFEMAGGEVSVMNGWHRGPSVDKGVAWSPSEVGGSAARARRRRAGAGSRPRNLTVVRFPETQLASTRQ